MLAFTYQHSGAWHITDALPTSLAFISTQGTAVITANPGETIPHLRARGIREMESRRITPANGQP